MTFAAPMPFSAAMARLESKTPVGSRLRSKDWGEVPLGLRDRAFFSAGVESVKVLAGMQQRIDTALSLNQGADEAQMDASKFIAEMRRDLGAAPGDSGELTDLTSTKRLGLIFAHQTEDAMEYGRWSAGQDADLLDAFPAQEFLRVEDRDAPREWLDRWIEAGGHFYAEAGNRMIAAKDDPVWAKLSRFGRPWPPFDFGSGMGVEDIDRAEAEALGVIAPGATVPPTEAGFNDGLQASLPTATPALLEGFKDIFGDQVDVNRDGKVVWQGQRVQRLYESALADPAVKWSLDLGRGTAVTSDKARAAGVDLPEDTRLVIDADHIRHAASRHGAGETQSGQRPLTALDFQLVPHVWRDPDHVKPGNLPGDLVFEKSLAGRLVITTWQRSPNGTVRLHSLYAKKEGGKP